MASTVYKWLLVPFLGLILGKPADPVPHPFHVSVVEINHNPSDKNLEISCKIFTDDFESVLVQNYKTKVDLINPPDRKAVDKLIEDYIKPTSLLQPTANPPVSNTSDLNGKTMLFSVTSKRLIFLQSKN